MSNAIDTITYRFATRCVVRKQEEKYLIYNTESDEMHLLSPLSYYLCSLCDGLSPLNEVQEIFSVIVRHEADGLKTPVADFLNQLLARGVVDLLE